MSSQGVNLLGCLAQGVDEGADVVGTNALFEQEAHMGRGIGGPKRWNRIHGVKGLGCRLGRCVAHGRRVASGAHGLGRGWNWEAVHSQIGRETRRVGSGARCMRLRPRSIGSLVIAKVAGLLHPERAGHSGLQPARRRAYSASSRVCSAQ